LIPGGGGPLIDDDDIGGNVDLLIMNIRCDN
jgi:hypothetical protein